MWRDDDFDQFFWFHEPGLSVEQWARVAEAKGRIDAASDRLHLAYFRLDYACESAASAAQDFVNAFRPQPWELN